MLLYISYEASMRAKLIFCIYNNITQCDNLASKIRFSPLPVALAAVRSKVVVLLLFIHCLLLLPLVVGVCVGSLFCCEVLIVLS